MATSLVTGATGFVGSHLIRRLAADGQQVNALTREASDAPHIQGVHWHRGDITDKQSITAALREVSVVYHLAAIVSGKGGHSAQWHVNRDGTRALLQACLENGVKRLVFLSSVCAYAPPLKTLIDEDCPLGGDDSYGQSKAAAELEITRGAPSDFCYVILRPCQVYGPGDRSGFTGLITSMLNSNYVFTAGHTPRYFSLVYIDDLVEAIIRAGKANISGSCTANITGPSLASLQTIVSASAKIKAHVPTLVAIPAPVIRFAQELRWLSRSLGTAGMRPHWKSYSQDHVYGSLLLGGPEYSLQRARSELGFEPATSIDDGLAKILLWGITPGA
ncbi:MAG: NAD-dependent epimerase/dehydratase family protein [Methylococcales bacterium]|nr:NAD-dependent epimerase/dehydratase family protein [Methylococcales bacterium]